jgi:ribose 5-phosphate isomerase RpiB
MGSIFVNPALSRKIVRVWLETVFQGGRHRRRLNAFKDIEKKICGARK